MADVNRGRGAMPTAQDVRDRLRIELEKAEKRGESHLVVKAGDLHRLVGGNPGRNNRVPLCCSVMKAEMRHGDEVLPGGPPSGQGPRLAIRYTLPR